MPTFLHAPITVGALEAGIHVLSEKPIARTATEAQAMVDAAHASGRVLEVAFNHRRRGDIEALKTAIDAGTIGRPYHGRAIWLRRAGIPALGSWFTNREMAGGGPLIDIGVHVLDYALYLFGEPKVIAVSAVTHSELGARGRGGAVADKQHVGSAYEVEDLASLLLRLEGGGSLVTRDELGGLPARRRRVRDHDLRHRRRRRSARRRLRPGGRAHHLHRRRTRRATTSVSPPTPAAVTAPSSRRSSSTSPTTANWAHYDGSLALDRARIIDAAYESAAAAPRSARRTRRHPGHDRRHRFEGSMTMSHCASPSGTKASTRPPSPRSPLSTRTGIHGAIAEGLADLLGTDARIRTATLADPEHGLSEEVLAETDVLLWWGHIAHDQVADEVVERVRSARARRDGADRAALRALLEDLHPDAGHDLLARLAQPRGRRARAGLERRTRRIRSPRASSSRS